METKLILWISSISMALTILGYGIYRIDAHGYNRCELKFQKAAAEAQVKSRTEIIKVEKKYEPIKTKILQDASPNAPVGHRVELAIDSLPEPHTH